MILFYLLEIQQLEGGSYDVNTILEAIKTITNWCISVGIALAGLSMVVGFILLAISDADKKQQIKARLTQTIFGIIGIVIAISLVNVIIRLF